MDQPIFEPGPGETPIWNEVTVVGLYADDIDSDALKEAIDGALASLSLAPCTLSLIEDQDWERAWLVDFKPLCFGDRLWVCPTGFEVDAGAGVIMELDPGLAFGTGTHPTTALCLEWLARHDLKDMRLIDYGCGSGILAIAAARLGAKPVYAVDIDPQCLAVTRENARQNDVERQLQVGSAEVLDCPATDVLLANILAGPLVQLAPRLSALVRPGGSIVLSGLLAEQIDVCLAAYGPSFTMDPAQIEGDWAMLTGRRH